MDEYAKKLQETVKKLGRENYYLERKGKVLRRFVRNYQDQVKVLGSFALMMFILEQLVIELYLLSLFDSNNTCVTIF